MSYKTYLGHTICRPETVRIEQLHNTALSELFLLLPRSRMSTNTSLMYTSTVIAGITGVAAEKQHHALPNPTMV
jgi:hypothetical protein